LLIAILLAIAVSGCTSTEDAAPDTDATAIPTATVKEAPEECVLQGESAAYDDCEECDDGCDTDTYRVDKENGIKYLGSVPNIECQQMEDKVEHNRVKLWTRVYNPSGSGKTYKFDEIKMSCVSGREAEYRIYLERTITLAPGRSFTKTIASGNVLDDLEISSSEPLTCWVAFILDGDEQFAMEVELEGQEGSGDADIIQIVETDEKWKK
jgi:hypothetical protein